MALTSSLELIEDQMLQYSKIVLNINDRAFTHRNIYSSEHKDQNDAKKKSKCKITFYSKDS